VDYNSIDTVNNSSASLTATFGSTPTLGNLLLLLAYAENDGSAAYSTPTPSGFTQVYNDSATNSHTGIWYRSDSTTTTATISDLGQNIFGGGLFFGEIANKVISGYPAVTTGSTATPTTVAGTTRIFDVQTPTVYTENFEYASSGNITTSNSIFNEVGATAVYAPAPTGRTGNVGALSSATDARLIVQGGAGWPITSGYVKLGSWIYFDDAMGTYEGIIGAQDQQGLYLGAGWGTWEAEPESD